MKPFIDVSSFKDKQLIGVSEQVSHVISSAISENRQSTAKDCSLKHDYYSDQPSYDHYRDK